MKRSQPFRWSRNPWFWLALGLGVVYIRGLFLDLMDVDASQYASIAMEMQQNGHWLQVQHRHADYLDKPPLLFWTSAFSFLLFGLHNWAYKLPSFLAALLGIYATWRFSLFHYSRDTARNAAFILAACIGLLLLCNDVRTDTLLMAMTACAMMPPYPPQGGSLRWGLFIGLAMLAKGPIGLIAPGFAIGTHLLLHRDWRGIFHWRWLLGLAVAALVLAPMCWGLYRQFDLHPDKIVNGRTGVSGLYFFFWEQSFGRITGENVWKNDTSPFYFLHVYLWAFLPWSFLLAGALGRRVGDLWREKFRLPAAEEAYSIGGFVLTFIALSMSRYKLPHYIFITLPWAAVLTARWLSVAAASNNRAWARWMYVQNTALFVLALAAFLLVGFVFPTTNLFIWGVLIGVSGYVAFRCWKNPVPADAGVAVQRSVLAFLGVAFALNFHFYPHLLPFQSTAAVPRYAAQHGIPAGKLAFFNRHGHALDFYAGQILPKMETPEQVRQTARTNGAFWLYTDAPGVSKLDSAGVRFTQTASFSHFQTALLKPAFLNPATRPNTLEPVFLLKILAEPR